MYIDNRSCSEAKMELETVGMRFLDTWLIGAHMIYIASPTRIATGGTEVLQQFCAVARACGYDAAMYYFEQFDGSPVQSSFSCYANPYVHHIDDMPNSCVLFPETHLEKLREVKRAKCAIWWLSVDNYFGSPYALNTNLVRKTWRHIKHIHIKETAERLMHFYQSEYARQYVVSAFTVSNDRVLSLSDYIDPAFTMNNQENQARGNNVLYNPRKGFEYTERLLGKAQGAKWIALSGYKKNELVDLMNSSKVYIDFGNHPGKDRLPREAAACGCCIITNRRGAAGNDIDVPIPERYKIHDEGDIEGVVSMIEECLDSYDSITQEFDRYRRLITGERSQFKKEVKLACSALTS